MNIKTSSWEPSPEDNVAPVEAATNVFLPYRYCSLPGWDIFQFVWGPPPICCRVVCENDDLIVPPSISIASPTLMATIGDLDTLTPDGRKIEPDVLLSSTGRRSCVPPLVGFVKVHIVAIYDDLETV